MLASAASMLGYIQYSKTLIFFFGVICNTDDHFKTGEIGREVELLISML